MRRFRILLTTGVTALLLGTGTIAAQSAAAATHAAPLRAVPGQTKVITVHMHPVKLHDGKMITRTRDGNGISNGTGQTMGNCGLATLILHAGASTYNLTLYSSAGGMGVGSYSVYTNGWSRSPRQVGSTPTAPSRGPRAHSGCSIQGWAQAWAGSPAGCGRRTTGRAATRSPLSGTTDPAPVTGEPVTAGVGARPRLPPRGRNAPAWLGPSPAWRWRGSRSRRPARDGG
jgi:hypothetical protein